MAETDFDVVVIGGGPGGYGAALYATSAGLRVAVVEMEQRLKEVTGVRLTVTVHASGELDPYTGSTQTTKLKRLADRRK